MPQHFNAEGKGASQTKLVEWDQRTRRNFRGELTQTQIKCIVGLLASFSSFDEDVGIKKRRGDGLNVVSPKKDLDRMAGQN